MIVISYILSFLDNVWPYALAVLMFLLLIAIHEFGHFIAAKLLGVRVNEFAIGFGPKLFSKQIGETKYALNLVPLGGYCAMEGEDEDSSDSKAFCNKKPWRRFIIVAMGAIFNLILGMTIVGISLSTQPAFTSTTVAEFNENASSSQSGLQVDDKIVTVNGRSIYSIYDLSYAFSNVDDGTMDITVSRNGEKIALHNVKFATEETDGMNYISVDFKVYGIKKTLGSFITQTVKTTISYGRIVWFSFIDLITGKYSISAMSGPVGVTKVIGSAAKENLLSVLPIMALISINLGIFNLFPIPALDGGRLLFILIEMVIRRPVSRKYEGFVHTIGFVLLIGFMLIITFKDIIYLWK